MANKQNPLTQNPIVRQTGKEPKDLTKKDLIRFIEKNGVRMLNFRYIGDDDRLKTLSFAITSKRQLDHLLTGGERVDGSSLFRHIDSAASDLYVVPRYRSAFLNPFAAVPSVDIMCSYYTKEGAPLASAPEQVVRKAHQALKERTGLEFEAMGELEFYAVYDKSPFYPMPAQRGYHESSPFCKGETLRTEALLAIAQAGGLTKYSHSEVGHIVGEEHIYEQHEIEFLPVPVEDAADQLAIAKWILRMIGLKHGVSISFAPKLMVGHAGSGLHIHTRALKNGRNAMVEKGALSDTARRIIAGYLDLAPSLTAFGNTIPISYLRLVPHQEAPTNICWGDRNRSVLVRVPLGWLNVAGMVKDANPREKASIPAKIENQTVEFRCPDGSANIYLLLAGLATAARHGMEMKNALESAKRLYVAENIFRAEHRTIREKLPQLPTSCADSADWLLKHRAIYEEHGVFCPTLIDGLVKSLRSYDDKDLSERLYQKGQEIRQLVDQYFHCA